MSTCVRDASKSPQPFGDVAMNRDADMKPQTQGNGATSGSCCAAHTQNKEDAMNIWGWLLFAGGMFYGGLLMGANIGEANVRREMYQRLRRISRN